MANTRRFKVEVAQFSYGTDGQWDVGPVLHTHYIMATDDGNAAGGVALELGLVAWAYEDVCYHDLMEVEGIDQSDIAFEASENHATHMLFVSEVK